MITLQYYDISCHDIAIHKLSCAGSLNRFVGYLEETAVETYINIVKHVDMPGSKLHSAWAHLAAPDIAVEYWQLPEGTYLLQNFNSSPYSLGLVGINFI